MRGRHTTVRRPRTGQRLLSSNCLCLTMSHDPLPTKTCPVCNREFEWRKKWEDDWENVKYCSERCRRNKDRDHVPWAKEAD